MRLVNASNRTDLLLHRVLIFYQDPVMADAFVKIVTRQHAVSLRLIDWLVTNYSKKLDVGYMVRRDGLAMQFNMHLSYKACLRAFSKRQFDPFARRDRVIARMGEWEVSTTVAQLCFFRWCLLNDVIAYAERHRDDIERDMLKSIAHRGGTRDGQQASRPKRRMLSVGRRVTSVSVDNVVLM
jgi:hypothetical protein